MKKIALLWIGYGFCLMLLGAMGWGMAGSRASLFAGGGSGLALIASGWMINKGWRAGFYLGAFILVALLCMFSWRYVLQGKNLSLVLIAASAGALVQGLKTSWTRSS